MTDHAHLAQAYVDASNETDAARRADRIAALFAEDVAYRDPMMHGDAHAGIDALIADVHEQFPGFRFTLKGTADGFGDNLRFSWTLGPDSVEAPIEGTDFVRVENGRMAAVTGFLDKVPAH